MARSRLTGVVLALALVAAACGSDGEVEVVAPTAEPTEEPTAAPTEEPTAEPTEEPTATAEPSPTDEPTPEATPTPAATATPEATPTPAATATPTLPGEPFDLYVPRVGEVVGVVGVAFDDILEVHELPGENSPLVGELPNLADDVIGTGEGRRLPASIWWRIEWQGIEGWVGSFFMARIGATFDITADVIAQNGNSSMAAETMLDLGMMVADLRKSTDVQSRIVVSGAPDVNDDLIGEITIDVIGLADDSQHGERLRIFGDGFDMGGEGFMLKSVEMTVLCGRGVDADGICI